MAIKSKFYGEGLTFDDVLLMPAYSEVLPREVSIVTNLTKDIRINIPMVSAAMDTVTEAPLAIALSREGDPGQNSYAACIYRPADTVIFCFIDLYRPYIRHSFLGLVIKPVKYKHQDANNYQYYS